MLPGDGDGGSGDASGDDTSGSGNDLEAVYINDLWHFVPNTTQSPSSMPGSTVASRSSVLSSMHSFVVYLLVVSVVATV